ncbi:MAG: transaldolase [Dehalococcoidales bacterium]
MKENPLRKLEAFGQSIWLDYIQRNLIFSGELKQLIKEDKIKGITSNPSIFEKAICGCHDYDADIQSMVLEGKDVDMIYEILSRQDVQSAADEFRPLYDTTEGIDGYVSLEVNPHLAHDTGETLKEARRLWAMLNRPNVLIKVPATEEGLPAIRQLIDEGINVNATLLFGIPRYQAVVEAYLEGLEARLIRRKPIRTVASVASFFISRIDTLVDPMLDKCMAQGNEKAELAKTLHGQIAIASAKIAYQNYQEYFSNSRFKKLAAKGAHPQRLLWASTGTKNPQYSDIKYVEALIGRDTINTLPVETLNAYRNHGEPEDRIGQETTKARWMLDKLPELGICVGDITQQLENEGVDKFNNSFDKLMSTIQLATRK